MRIHKMEVQNFRGISAATWITPTARIGLIGAGDSGKSTLLDAIELVFWPKYALALTDNDLYKADSASTAVVRAWVIDPPADLTHDGAFFTHLMGYDPTTETITPEPSAGPLVLGVELTFDGELEPEWHVFNEHADPKRISAADRARFGVSRISEALATHLRWGRGSSLTRLSTDARSSLDEALRSAARTARTTANTSGAFDVLNAVTTQLTTKGKQLRAFESTATVTAALDADILNVSHGAISLHESDLPVGRRGLGSRRLTSIAAQLTELSGVRVILIDEIEAGLEPHRIRHLLRALSSQMDGGTVDQLFFSTHSPTPVRELRAPELNVVRRSTDAVVTTQRVPIELQGAVRAHAEALLAPRVLVCEGITEIGFARGVMDWSEESANGGHTPVAATADAGGASRVVGYANSFIGLGYPTAVFCDDDEPSLVIGDLTTGVTVLQTQKTLCLELQATQDLTAAGLKAFAEYGLISVELDKLKDKLKSRQCHDGDLDALLTDTANTDQIGRLRPALGATAKKDGGDWFKSVDGGAALAAIALVATSPDSHLAIMIRGISEWCRGD
jgi:putative ATP-dependent endonuclease of OLD family